MKSRHKHRIKYGLPAGLSRPPATKHQPPVSLNYALWLARLCLAVSVGISTYLLWHAISNGPVGGCGPGSGCDRVLGSSWAYFLGIPVTAPGLAAYLALLGISWRFRRYSSLGLLGVLLCISIIGAALWFFGLQLWVIKSFCPWCCTAHGFAVLASGLMLHQILTTSRPSVSASKAGATFSPAQASLAALAGLMLVAALAGSQTLFPKQRNLLSVYEGKFQFDREEVPILGARNAPKALVSLFDYTCPDCHELHKHLMTVLQQFTNALCIVALPMPLDSRCNSAVRVTPRKHLLACDYAKIGLAVQRANRQAFADYDQWIFAQKVLPSLDQAKTFAQGLVGKARFEKSMTDPWIGKMITNSVALYQENRNRTRSGQMPQLIIGDKLNIGPVRRTEDLFALVEKHLALKRPAP